MGPKSHLGQIGNYLSKTWRQGSGLYYCRRVGCILLRHLSVLGPVPFGPLDVELYGERGRLASANQVALFKRRRGALANHL